LAHLALIRARRVAQTSAPITPTRRESGQAPITLTRRESRPRRLRISHSSPHSRIPMLHALRPLAITTRIHRAIPSPIRTASPSQPSRCCCQICPSRPAAHFRAIERSLAGLS
jgi:hypothetical protein